MKQKKILKGFLIWLETYRYSINFEQDDLNIEYYLKSSK